MTCRVVLCCIDRVYSVSSCAFHQATCNFFTRAAAGRIVACIGPHLTRSPSSVKYSSSMAPASDDGFDDDWSEVSIIGWRR